MVFCTLPVGPDRSQLPENCCRESFGNCLHAATRQPPRLANIKGKPTKRIVRTLTTESSGGNRLTYEKELLNSRENSHFCKTNHPGFPHALPPYDKKGRVSSRGYMKFVLSSSFNLNVNYAAGIMVGGVPPSFTHFGVTP